LEPIVLTIAVNIIVTASEIAFFQENPKAPQRLGGEFDRLPAVENGFDDVGSEEGEGQDAADLGFMQGCMRPAPTS
jgi:hypothetical protein